MKTAAIEKKSLKSPEMEDGTQIEIGPGDAAMIPPGHDAWVVGNEPVVAIDVTGVKDYAKPGLGKL